MPETSRTGASCPAIAVVPAGWWLLADAAGFYPEDLPEDWRLGYFANEHVGVYLPLALWQTLPTAALSDWRGDVHERFGFFLERPAESSAAPARRQAVEQALGRNLVAWVSWASTPGTGSLLSPDTMAQGTMHLGQALHCPPALLADLRAGAGWLREHADTAPATLVILPQPSSTQLHDWRRLGALLGYSELSPAGAGPCAAPA